MKLTTSFAIAALALFAASTAIAQTTPAKAVVPAKPAVVAPAATATPAATAPAADKAAKSKACSLQADAKKLHGKERKKFREECKKAA